MAAQLRRLRAADRLVAAGALALLLFMFVFAWFGESLQGKLRGSYLSGAGSSLTGWETFTNSRWVWLLTAVVALATVIARAGSWRPRESLQLGFAVALLGAASVVLILYRIVHHPANSGGFGGFHVSLGIRIGIWLALLAAIAITIGGLLQLRDELAPSQPQPAPDESARAAFSGLTVSSGPARGAGEPPPPPPAAPQEREGPPDPPRGAP
jgi:hypothetical protein